MLTNPLAWRKSFLNSVLRLVAGVLFAIASAPLASAQVIIINTPGGTEIIGRRPPLPPQPTPLPRPSPAAYSVTLLEVQGRFAIRPPRFSSRRSSRTPGPPRSKPSCCSPCTRRRPSVD